MRVLGIFCMLSLRCISRVLCSATMLAETPIEQYRTRLCGPCGIIKHLHTWIRRRTCKTFDHFVPLVSVVVCRWYFYRLCITIQCIVRLWNLVHYDLKSMLCTTASNRTPWSLLLFPMRSILILHGNCFSHRRWYVVEVSSQLYEILSDLCDLILQLLHGLKCNMFCPVLWERQRNVDSRAEGFL